MCAPWPDFGQRYRFKDGSKLQEELNVQLSGSMYQTPATVTYVLVRDGYDQLKKVAFRTALGVARAAHPLKLGFVPTKKEVSHLKQQVEQRLFEQLFKDQTTCRQEHVHCGIMSQLASITSNNR